MLPADLDIAIIAPFPTAVRIQEGWMSRIASVDRVFSELKRLYVSFSRNCHIEIDDRLVQHDVHAWEICFNPDERAHQALFTEIVNRVRGLYVHTIHLAEFIQAWLPSGKFVVDIHGIVPEEETMLGRSDLALRYAAVEQEVLEHARQVVVVTNAMARHFREKYPNLSPSFLTLPIFESYRENTAKFRAPHPQQDLPVSVVYAGGMQAWQNLDAMLHLAYHCQDFSTFTFLSHQAEEIRTRAREILPHLVASYRFCEKDHLPNEYAQHDFGLVLRNDIAVNRVSCPTKLSEYLYFGVIPIVRSPYLGDFADLGYWYVTEEEFAKGFFPDEATRKWMIEANQEVMFRLRQRFSESATLLCELFGRHELPKFLSFFGDSE